MSHYRITNIKLDELCIEAATYLESFWNLKLAYLRMAELEDEMQRALLAQEMNEFHRRCVDNDKPGKRHMMPFYWRKDRSYDGKVTETQIPIKVGSPKYDWEMGRYKARMAALKERTPNYGKNLHRPE
jgi:hypothetical protein